MALIRRFTACATALAVVTCMAGCGSFDEAGPPRDRAAGDDLPSAGAAVSMPSDSAPASPSAQRRWRQLGDQVGDVRPAPTTKLGIDIASLGIAASPGRGLAVRLSTVRPVVDGTVAISLPTANGTARVHIRIATAASTARLRTGGRSVNGRLVQSATRTTVSFPVDLRVTGRPTAVATSGRSRDEAPDSRPTGQRRSDPRMTAPREPRADASHAW